MSLRTYKRAADYRELEAAPLINTALRPTSSQRFEQLKSQNHYQQTSKNLHTMKLAGGGEISFVAPASDERSKLKAAQSEMKRQGIKRSLVVDVKNHKADFSGMDLKGAVITGKMPTNLTKANCEGATFYKIGGGSVAPGANFKNATFRDANIEGTQARGANFDGVQMFGTVDATRLDAPNSSWKGAKASGIRITHANLSGATFQNTDFSNAEAARANLGGSRGSLDLSGAKAEGISLRHAHLNLQAPNADLRLGDLMGAELNNPNFENASLDKHSGHGAKIKGVSAAMDPAGWAKGGKKDVSFLQRNMRMQALSGPSFA